MRTLFGFTGAALYLFLCVPANAASCSSITANLVANCGFETGTFSSWSLSGNDVPLALNNLYGVEGTDPLDGISPHSGTSQAYIADLDSNATTLSQTLTTTPSASYTLSFFLAQDTLSTALYPNEFIVSFGGVTVASVTGIPVEGYTDYSYLVRATSSSSVLSLTIGNGLGESLLDDISVVPTPEPPALMLMLTGVMGLGFLWKRSLVTAK